MLKLYQDKDWLENKYSNEELSTIQIGRECGVGSTKIQNWMKKLEVKIRSRDEARHLKTLRQVNHCRLSLEAIEWLNGELLGDGCLYSYSNYSAAFFYGASKKDYTTYVSETLKSFGIEQVGGGRIYTQYSAGPNGNYHYSYECVSLCYAELLPLRKKWYPEGKKIVPRDIKLTPITCRQWYIGDGCLGHPKDSSPCITLCTNGFPIPDVEFLKDELIKLGFKTTRQPAGNILHISTKSVKDFLNYIGPCPVDCYQYKWSYWRGDN